MASTHFAHGDICSPEALVEHWSGGAMQSNPDISGIGASANSYKFELSRVTIGFMGPAFLVFALLLFTYLFAYDPLSDPFVTDHEVKSQKLGNTTSWKPNPIDVEFLRLFRRLFGVRGSWSSTTRILHEVVMPIRGSLEQLSLRVPADHATLVAGLSILVSGFASLGNDTETPLTASDWYMIAYLTWFVNTTHLAGLTVLRTELHKMPTLRCFRVVLMFALLVLLVVALVPTAFFNWDAFGVTSPVKDVVVPTAAVPQSPARCYFSMGRAQSLWNVGCAAQYTGWRSPDPPFCKVFPEKTDIQPVHKASSFEAMVVAVMMLVVGFATRCVKLFPSFAGTLRRRVREPLSKSTRRILLGLTSEIDGTEEKPILSPGFPAQLWTDLVVLPCVGFFLGARWTVNLFNSTLFEVFWIAITIVWGFFKIYAIRATKMQTPESASEENAWTFGQAMSLSLFALQVLLLIARLHSANRDFSYRRHRTEEVKHSSLFGQTVIPNSERPQLLLQQLSPVLHLDTPEHTSRTSHASKVIAVDQQRQERPPSAKGMHPQKPSKVQLLRHLIQETRPDKQPTWLAVCTGTSCIFWVVLAGLAMFMANNTPANGKPSTGAWMSMSGFWLTDQAMIAAVLVYLPISWARDVVLGLHLELACLRSSRSGRIPAVALAGYCLCIGALHVGFSLASVNSGRYTPLAVTWLYSLAPFCFYVVASVFCNSIVYYSTPYY
ncbi:uncharacterized protein B0I36DRAFT_411471 [Microdochium trichocladiopsis]|uniref:Uncharacterized protein n=1 Tax=Microdochium trichocladiopsis TaxID=1682393 RepID=A0A9P9BPQ4_9PEZI|nr:uncharacterized protein B0I36DRAFT_411471 [Microdochium trichocladiopsis]KAH7029514.1 hypothetical protein B0I36DRAFT_411471 [Microdochium trichocladiopsis]